MGSLVGLKNIELGAYGSVWSLELRNYRHSFSFELTTLSWQDQYVRFKLPDRPESPILKTILEPGAYESVLPANKNNQSRKVWRYFEHVSDIIKGNCTWEKNLKKKEKKKKRKKKKKGGGNENNFEKKIRTGRSKKPRDWTGRSCDNSHHVKYLQKKRHTDWLSTFFNFMSLKISFTKKSKLNNW